MIGFRKLVEADKEILTSWLLTDPEHHALGMEPEFFFREDALSMVIGDVQGPGLYVRIDSEPPDSVRLHIQFGPSLVKSGKTLLRAWPEFKARVEAAGVKRMIFESKSRHLIGFCSRCFGFKSCGGNDYELRLA